jgi:hypothetical protein
MQQKSSFQKAIVALMLCGVMTFVGCTASWVSTFDTVISVAAPALTGILDVAALADGKPVDAALVTKINADAAAVETLAKDFANASSSAGPGLCSQLQVDITTYESDLPLVLQVAQVSDPNTEAKIEALSALIVSTFNSIEPLIPNCAAPAKTSLAVAVPLSVKNFVNAYNAEMVKPTGNPQVDAGTAKLKLHTKSTFMRVVTFSWL